MLRHCRIIPTLTLAVPLLFVLATPVSALAQDARPASGASKELTTLESDLDREALALSTSDCAVACRALASIRRAADRICALDPDVRCSAARAKADEATKRVRQACPECVAASTPPPEPKPAPPPSPSPDRGAPREFESKGGAETAAVQSSPPSESKRGGCAGCTIGSQSPVDPRAVGLALAALALLRRRRLHRPPHALRSKV